MGGADFHKGVGSCPVPCSIIMFNNIADSVLLSKKEGSFIDMHQLAFDFSFTSPADFTLETSRPGGAALAALASLHALGINSYRINLANLIKLSLLTKKLLSNYNDVIVYNKNSLGHVTMFGLCPPRLKTYQKRFSASSREDKELRGFVEIVNKYTKEFFSWDYKDRILNNLGVEYSFSGGYMELSNGIKISAVKLYPVSPHLNKSHIERAVKIIMKQKVLFDQKIWKRE